VTGDPKQPLPLGVNVAAGPSARHPAVSFGFDLFSEFNVVIPSEALFADEGPAVAVRLM